MDNSKNLELLASLYTDNYHENSVNQNFNYHKRSISEISAWEEHTDETNLKKIETSLIKKSPKISPGLRSSFNYSKSHIAGSPVESKIQKEETNSSTKLPDIRGATKPFYRYTTEDAIVKKPSYVKRPTWLANIKIIRINEFKPSGIGKIQNVLKITSCFNKDKYRSLSTTKKIYK